MSVTRIACPRCCGNGDTLVGATGCPEETSIRVESRQVGGGDPVALGFTATRGMSEGDFTRLWSALGKSVADVIYARVALDG